MLPHELCTWTISPGLEQPFVGLLMLLVLSVHAFCFVSLIYPQALLSKLQLFFRLSLSSCTLYSWNIKQNLVRSILGTVVYIRVSRLSKANITFVYNIMIYIKFVLHFLIKSTLRFTLTALCITSAGLKLVHALTPPGVKCEGTYNGTALASAV